jgi:hypothetical protein
MTVDKVIRGLVTAGFGVGAAAVFGVLGAQSADAAPAPPSPPPSSPADIAKQDAADKRTAQRPKVNSSAESTKQDAEDKRTAADAGSPARKEERAQGRKNAEQRNVEGKGNSEQRKVERKENSSADDRKQDAEDKRTAADAGSPARKEERAQGRRNAEQQKVERKRNSSVDDRKQDAEDKRTAADAGNPARKEARAKGKRAAKMKADRREAESFEFAPTDGFAATGAVGDGIKAGADEVLKDPAKKARAARDAAYDYVNASKAARASGVPASPEERARIADLNKKAKAAADQAKDAIAKGKTVPRELAVVGRVAGKISPVAVIGSEVYEVAVNEKPADEAVAEGIGSIAGGTLGAIGGGALGSLMLPGPGTAAGAAGGSLAGGYVGGAVGENSYKWLKQNVHVPPGYRPGILDK